MVKDFSVSMLIIFVDLDILSVPVIVAKSPDLNTLSLF